MHIKRFEGRDLQEALARVRGELGPEAVILETGRAPGAGTVTILAAHPRPSAAEPESSSYPMKESRSPSRLRLLPEGEATGPARIPVEAGTVAGGSAPPWQRMAGAWRGARAASSSPAAAPHVARQVPVSEELKGRIAHLSRLVRSDHFSAVPLPLRQLYLDLTDAEVDADLVFSILRRMGDAPLPGQFIPAPPDDVLALLRGLVRCGGAVEAGPGRRVLALVGPTGVGKTTTVAKIAGQAAFGPGRRVALVSSDTYRVFGAQHLASYAALMGLPFQSVATAAELRWLLEGEFAGADLVLIDTSGRSPRDPRGIEEIRQLLAACPDLDIQLVLPANARARDLALALESFRVLPVDHLLFTKVDEATSIGGAFSTTLKARRPVSYLGTGQEVPDDLVPASVERLTAGLLAGGEHE